MKQIKLIGLMAIVILMVTSQSCKKGFLDGVNDNPNSPTSVSARVILPSAQVNLAYAQGGDVSRYTSIMSQYIIGASRQFVSYQNYSFTEEDFNNVWNNMYAATMSNFRAIENIEAANPGAYTIYDGIAKIMMAYSLGMTTDLWGDVPFSEAFQGNLNLTPNYDSQEDIYDHIQHLLSDAIEQMSNDPGDDFDTPDANDFVFGGDVDAWISFAYALKARYHIHLTNLDGGVVHAQEALDAILAGGVLANPGVKFAPGATSAGPWFQYIDQRDDIVYDGACIGIMIDRNDPRYPVYIDVNGDQGHWDVGYLGAFFQAEDAVVYFMTEFERKFIEAEARLWTGDLGGAQTAFTEALQASMDFYGVDGSAYIAEHGTLNTGTELEQIITEKWIANYLHPESWVDIRRTGFPVLTPNSGSQLPNRFIYPTNERLYNPQSLPGGGDNSSTTLYAPKLWWNP